MDICLIWAQSSNRAIGKDGMWPWSRADDLHRFQLLTEDHPVLMGRRAWESFPDKPLAGRQNFVLTQQQKSIPGAVACASLHEALTLASVLRSGKLFVLGGATVYAQGLRIADRLYVTQLDIDVADADAFAPAIDLGLFELVSQSRGGADRGPGRTFQEYRRRRLH